MMDKLYALTFNDIRNISRDRIMLLLILTPFSLILGLRFGIPVVIERFPFLNDYYHPILALACLIISSFPAILISFLMLDEKDEDIFSVYRVLPIAPGTFLLYRMAFTALFSFLFSNLVIHFSQLITISVLRSLGVMILFSLIGPILILAVITFARNKVEGLSILKVLTMFLTLPVSIFFIDPAWKRLLAVLPLYWTLEAFTRIGEGQNFLFYFLVALIFQTFLIWLLYKQFRKRVF